MDALIKRITITASLVVLFLFGCSPGPMEEYRNSDKGFAISFPKEWEKKENQPGAVVVALEPEQESDGFFRSNVAVIVSTVPPGVKSNDYYDRQFNSLTGMAGPVKDFKLILNRFIAIDGHQGKELTYSYSIGELRLFAMTRMVVHGDKGFFIIGTSADFGKFQLNYNKIAESFELL